MPQKKSQKYSKEAIEQYVKQKIGRRLAFGFDHCQRVYRLARKLGKGYDDEILHAVAFLHDIELGKDHENRSAKQAALVLKRDMSASDIFRVQEAIKNHGALGQPKSVEGILVHDASLLDCLGGIGLLQLAFLFEKQGKKTMGDIVTHIGNYREIAAEKLILKQSKSLGAERVSFMDLALSALDKELKIKEKI